MTKKIRIESDDDNGKQNGGQAPDGGDNPGGAYGTTAAASASGKSDEKPGVLLPDDPAELKKLLSEKSAALEAAERQRAEYLDHLQRLKAEFENYKKRTAREKQDTIRYANEQLLSRLLGVLDNLKRGAGYAAKNAQDEEILKGIQLVQRQVEDLAADFGVKPFECAGKPFDPNFHEPLYTVENPDIEPNTVVDEVETGYLYHEKVLRPAKVSVSRRPENNDPAS